MKFNPNSEDMTPQETALVVAAEGINVQLRSRAHLLAVIDALDMSKESTDSKMSFVLGLMSLGFSSVRARKRLGLSKSQVTHWRKKNEDNRQRYLEARARGELMLEETVLLAAERDPEWANTVLLKRDKEEDELETEEDNTIDVTSFLKKDDKDPLD